MSLSILISEFQKDSQKLKLTHDFYLSFFAHSLLHVQPLRTMSRSINIL